MMMSCKEVATLLSSGTPLSPLRRMSLGFHLFMCKHCSHFKKHMDILTTQIRKILKEKVDVPSGKVRELEDEVLDRLTGEGFK